MEIIKLIEDLNGPAEADRLFAAEDLVGVGDVAAVAALVSRLSVEPSRAVKEAIFHALTRIRDHSVMCAAIILIEADDAFVRNEAVRLLGTFGAEAMPALIKAVGGEDSDVRKFALDAMATIASELKDVVYRKVLCDTDINIVITTVEHIGREGNTALKESVEAVLEQAGHPMLIAACVEALGEIGNGASLDVMYRKLGSEEMPAFQVPGFIRAVGRLGTDAHVDLLCRFIELFPATLSHVGFDAIDAIRGRVLLPQAPPAVLAAVQSIVEENCDPLEHYKAVRALGAFADQGTVELIRKYLQSEEKMVRLAAVESIARWNASNAVNLLATRKTIETDEDVLAAIQDSVNQHTRNPA
jgi:HEAT repeat protein